MIFAPAQKLSDIQSTLALRTPRQCGQEPVPPAKHSKEMTEINSHYYGLSLLRECGQFPASKRDSSLVFFSLDIADTRVLRQKS